MDHLISAHDGEPKLFWRTRYAAGLLVLGAIAVYLLVSEHRAHFVFALPFLLLLACPLMHVFMHHGHGGHATDHIHQHNDQQGPNTSDATSSHGDAKP